MRRPIVAASLAGAACAVLIAGTGLGAVAPASAKKTSGWIEALAMDGRLVAYGFDNQASGCHKVIAWNPVTGWAGFVSGTKGGRCGDDESSGMNITGLAVAGQRVAWVRNITGNTESDDALYTATLPKPSERRLASAVRTGDVDAVLTGDWIGGLVGDGTDLLVNRWRTDGDGAVVDGSLDAVRARGLRTVVRGPEAVRASSVDAGRVAVLRRDGKVALYSSKGASLRTLAPASVRELALRTDMLVVLTKAKTLEIYNANTGTFVRSWPVAAGARHLDVHSGVAIYAVGKDLHGLRLATGRDVVLVSTRRAIVGAEVEAPGVVYAFNTVRGGKAVGNLAYLPMRRVVDAVS